MSNNNNIVNDAAKKYSVRNITKEFHAPLEIDPITTQFHIELGEKSEMVIVQDRDIDWVELANRDVDTVGLANILEIARRRGDDLSSFAFKDDEAMDLSELDPMNPQKTVSLLKGQDESRQKLEALADQLGVSVSDLISAAVNGTLEKVISDKVDAAKSDDKEG